MLLLWIQPFAFVSIFGFLPEVQQLYYFQSSTEYFFPTTQHSTPLVCFQVQFSLSMMINDCCYHSCYLATTTHL